MRSSSLIMITDDSSYSVMKHPVANKDEKVVARRCLSGLALGPRITHVCISTVYTIPTTEPPVQIPLLIPGCSTQASAMSALRLDGSKTLLFAYVYMTESSGVC